MRRGVDHRVWIAVAVAACAEASHGGGGPPDSKVVDTARGRIDAPPADATDAPVSGSCASPFSGVLATWDFSAQTGSEASLAATTTVPGVVATGFTRSAALTAASGSGSINSSGWSTLSMRDTTKYYTVSVGPPTGCTISLTSISIDAKSSATGPMSAVAATSVDSFGGTGAVSTSMPSTPALSVGNALGAVEIRIYGYSASSAAGTLRVQNTFTITGSLQ